MKKVTDLGYNEVIHCPTEAEAIAICQLMHDAGLRWLNGKSYLEYTNFLKDICYIPKSGTFTLDGCLAYGDIIYPASDFLPPDFYKVDEAHNSVVIDSVKHDEQPEPKIGQLWECLDESFNKVGTKALVLFYDTDSGTVDIELKHPEHLIVENLPVQVLCKNFRFHSDPNEQPEIYSDMQVNQAKTFVDDLRQQVMMVSDPTIPSPELLAVYEALDSKGKKIMREKMPNVKWPKVKEYVSHQEWQRNSSWVDVKSMSSDEIFVLTFKDCRPEVDEVKGEIRFVKV